MKRSLAALPVALYLLSEMLRKEDALERRQKKQQR